jgi:hypothetical protein
MVILAGVFKFQPQDGMSMGPSRPKKSLKFKINITVCLRRAGEILPDKNSIEDINDNQKFSQLMRNKTVHLLALFLAVFIGIEVTMGGMIYFFRQLQDDCHKSDWFTVNQDGL